MKVLFFRPPKHMWPFHSENSSFWQPLAFASMAAVLRQGMDDIDVKIVDCAAEKKGWKTAEAVIEREKPDALCVGEETVSASEALRAAAIAKEKNPDAKVVAGGVYFSNMLKDTLTNSHVDFVVRGEGELTLLELLKEMQKDEPDYRRVKGIAFMHQNRPARTPDRPLLDMEQLPMPAYDLLDMDVYGRGARSHKDFVAVEHSRGCVSRCSFCVLWKQMGNSNGNGIEPCYRTKSVAKTISEVEHLHEKYKRKTFCWVDPTWNVDAKWSSEFSDSIVQRGIDASHLIWARSDFIVRDEQKGILKKQIRAGVNQFMIGIERTNDQELKDLDKVGIDFETTRRACEILMQYPSALTVATYIYGLPWETRKSMKQFYDGLAKIPFDIGVPLPLNPNPGTRFYDELIAEGLMEIDDFDYFNFVNVVARSKEMSRHSILLNMLYNEIRVRTVREQFASSKIGFKRRRGAVRSLARVKARMLFRFFGGMVSDALLGKPVNMSTRPGWYDD